MYITPVKLTGYIHTPQIYASDILTSPTFVLVLYVYFLLRLFCDMYNYLRRGGGEDKLGYEPL
jgi:hypothetical protein